MEKKNINITCSADRKNERREKEYLRNRKKREWTRKNQKKRVFSNILAQFLAAALFFTVSTDLLASSYVRPYSVRVPLTEQKEKGREKTNIKDLGLYAKAAVLLDGSNDRILYGKNARDVLPNASTTKILTCILAIESGDLDRICTVSKKACNMPETKCGYPQGSRFLMKDLLYSLMLESHNDSAVVIAEAVAGSVEAFAEKMNEKAREIGCEDTHFVTPNGLDGRDAGGDHGTTAYDLARIMNYCRKNETFLTITRAKNHTFSDVDKKHIYQLSNKNSFLSMQSGVLSGKTGYTAKAGYCYVGAYEEHGKAYTWALLACGWPNYKTYKWSDSKKLIAYGNETYQKQEVQNRGELPDLKILHGVVVSGKNISYPEQVKLREEEKALTCLLADFDEVTVTYDCPKSLEAPVKKGQEAGRARYYVNDTYIGSKKIYTDASVEAFDLGWCLEQLLGEFLQKGVSAL